MYSKMHSHKKKSNTGGYGGILFVVGIMLIPTVYVTYRAYGPGAASGECAAPLRATTWNIAAVNNNPFEYWVTHPDPAYNKLMANVQTFIDSPTGAEDDVAVEKVITPAMFDELKEEFLKAGVSKDFVVAVEKQWKEEYKSRKIITEFVKDKTIGSKRLASMPDRVTNTINTAAGTPTMRPTPVNCYGGEMGDIPVWWKAWKTFMFKDKVTTVGGGEPKTPFEMLLPIQHDKYPAISEEEQKISIPLQTLGLAIFDAALVHMLARVGRKEWQPLRTTLCNSLNLHKDDNIMRILKERYYTSDVIFLQETSASFAKKFEGSALGSKFALLKPAKLETKRDQNSIVLVDRTTFAYGSLVDVTDKVLALVEGSPAAPGDLFAVSIRKGDKRMLLASFHGDTNGLATKPVVSGVYEAAKKLFSDHILLMGLDANTYKEHNEKYQGVLDFNSFLAQRNMSSCWAPMPDPLRPTTCNARTYLQPQLNKAIRSDEKLSKGDVNLKDWIIFFEQQWKPSRTTRDNTGEEKYTEEMVFPTLTFPSDHATISTRLTPNGQGKCGEEGLL